MFSFCAPLEVPEVKTRTKMVNACEWPEQGDSTYTQFAVYITLVAGWQGGEKHSVHWWVGQPFDARNPGTLQCRCCRLIVLWSTGWGEVLQDRTFWVLEAEQWNRHKQSGWKSIPYSAVLMHPTGKALCLAHVRSCLDLSGSGSHSSKRKGKKLWVSQRYTRWLRWDTETKDLSFFALMRRRLQKNAISLFSYREGWSMLFWMCTGRSWEVINELQEK